MKRNDLFLRLFHDYENSSDAKTNQMCEDNNMDTSSVLTEDVDYSALVSAFFIGNPFKKISRNKA